MHLQNATFRRPATEDDSVVPHFMIVDEYSRYINPDVEIFLSLAATYKVAGIFAIQSLSQLEIESGKYSAKAMRKSILTNTRNKIVFGGVAMDDAKAFSEMFGEDEIVMRQSTYKNRIVLPNIFPDSYRDTETQEVRFTATDIMDQLPRFTYVHQLMQGGKLQEPALGLGGFVPREWKELREWEVKPTIDTASVTDKITEMFKSNKKKFEEDKQKAQEHYDTLEKDLAIETEEEIKLYDEMEGSLNAGYKEDSERYRAELAKEGITERDLLFTEQEIGRGEVIDPFGGSEPAENEPANEPVEKSEEKPVGNSVKEPVDDLSEEADDDFFPMSDESDEVTKEEKPVTEQTKAKDDEQEEPEVKKVETKKAKEKISVVPETDKNEDDFWS